MGALIIPRTHYFVTGGKDGNIYLLDKDNMGGLQVTGNQVQQTVFFSGDSFHCQPAFTRWRPEGSYMSGRRMITYVPFLIITKLTFCYPVNSSWVLRAGPPDKAELYSPFLPTAANQVRLSYGLPMP